MTDANRKRNIAAEVERGRESVTIIGINTISEDALCGVMAEMRKLGPPTIRVLLHEGKLYAIEGTHRLAAAKKLRRRPTVVIVADDTTDAGVVVPVEYAKGTQTVSDLRATYVDGHNEIAPTFKF